MTGIREAQFAKRKGAVVAAQMAQKECRVRIFLVLNGN